ncbi:Flp pilus assembly protein CpaB [uncultured Porticoccus sp.]|uniref:Flp pilus assembly protein CpaB n=1 Tax=uncultured Porticoccus sp. TaxID=1256050 RepID=UPI002619B13B|nr:Flp pilus assembly protein CpaB [uncultured Porticoccus sp.]
MNSKVMLGVAVLLLGAAGVTAYWGVLISEGQENVARIEAPVAQESIAIDEAPLKQAVQEVSRPGVNVIVLAQSVSKDRLITADDLAVEIMRIAPPGSYSELDPLIGKRLFRDLPAGTVLNEDSFSIGGPLARMIRDSERALAIQADEVITSGGHLSPGDYVDVLLFLKEGDRNADRTMQVVVPALRVLSVGDRLGLTVSGEPVFPAIEEEQQSVNRRSAAARTVVLAVPQVLLTRFALAAQVGSLRLAVRSADEPHLTDFYADRSVDIAEPVNQQLYQFEKFVLGQAKRPQAGLIPGRPKGVEVFKGSVVSRVIP